MPPKCQSDRFRNLRRLARIVRRMDPAAFDIRIKDDGCRRCALGEADRVGFAQYAALTQWGLSWEEYTALFNTNYSAKFNIKPISWYSRVQRLIKRKERESDSATK